MPSGKRAYQRVKPLRDNADASFGVPVSMDKVYERFLLDVIFYGHASTGVRCYIVGRPSEWVNAEDCLTCNPDASL